MVQTSNPLAEEKEGQKKDGFGFITKTKKAEKGGFRKKKVDLQGGRRSKEEGTK